MSQPLLAGPNTSSTTNRMARGSLFVLLMMGVASLMVCNAPAILIHAASFSAGSTTASDHDDNDHRLPTKTTSSSLTSEVADKAGVLLSAAVHLRAAPGAVGGLSAERQTAVKQKEEASPLPLREPCPDRTAPPGFLRRRLNNQREDCPTNSLYHCDNPNTIMSDPDVACDLDTCEWDTSLLNPDREPTLCRSITITNVSALDDYLEPCLWWEMLYGDLANGTIPPEDGEVEEPPQDTGGADAGSGGGGSNVTGTEPEETTDWIEFETILLTFLVDSAESPSSSSVASPSATTSNDKESGDRKGRFLRRQRQSLQRRRRALRQKVQARELSRRSLGQQRMDPDVLIELTKAHLLNELEGKLGTSDVADVSLVITPVSAASSSSSSPTGGGWSANGLESMSQAVNGKLKFNKSIEKQVDSPGVVQHMVDKAFEGDAMDRFLESLKGSGDPVMRRIQIVYKGLPSDLQDSDPSSSPSSSSVDSFEWSDWWIFVVVGSAVGVLVFCLSFSCLSYRRWTSRPHPAEKMSKADTVDPVKSNDDTAPADEPDDPNCIEDSNKPKSAREDPTDGSTDRQEEEARTPAEDPKVNGNISMEVSEIDDSESYLGRYHQNEATSVYSYIDGHTTLLMEEDNHSSYSIAPSLLYDRVMPDDQSIQSRMWSVADSITYDSSSRAAPVAGAPGQVLVIAGGEAEGVTSEGGDDDDYSLLSELNNAPEGNVKSAGGDLRVLEVVKRPDETDRESVAASPKATKIIPAARNEALKPPSRSPPYTNMDRDDEDDEESSTSDCSYGPSASDASHGQKETAEVVAADNVSPDIAIKKKLGSKGVSVRVRKSKENLLNNTAVLAALAESSASDDDSSLFMGPSDIGKGSSLLHLSARDMVGPHCQSSTNDTDRCDKIRFGPLRVGRKNLAKKEKEQLHREAMGSESRNNGNQVAAFPIPRQLVSTSEEKKDDTSFSSIGSIEAPRAMAPMDSAASC